MLQINLRKPLRVFLGFCGLCLTLNACALQPPQLNDLQLVSVETANFSTATEIEWYSPDPRPSQKLLKINFSSHSNFMTYTFDYEYGLIAQEYLCDRPKEKAEIEHFPGVYYKNTSANKYYISYGYKEYHKSYSYDGPIFIFNDDPILYQIYIYQKFDGYNLEQNPEDVCFEIVSYQPPATFLRSNTIRIPKEAIAEALKRQ